MDFEKKQSDLHKNQMKKYHKRVLNLSYEFSKQAVKEFGSLIKGIVLFGSAARRAEGKDSDIDILVILDDLTVVWSKEMIETYQIISEKIVKELSDDLHITTLKLSTFWDYVRNSDPVGMTILREGVALVDTGFIAPMQMLLQQGKIRPSNESVWVAFHKAETTLHNSKWHMLSAVIDCYWACVDACHAALMRMDVVPPTPDHVSELLQKHLVKPGYIDATHAKSMQQLYEMYKAITHRKVDEMSADHYEQYYHKAEALVADVKKFLQKPVSQLK